MPFSTPYLPARYYVPLGQRLAGQGLDVAMLLSDAGIPPDLMDEPQAQLKPERLEALIRLAVERSHNTALGFELGRILKFSSHDILGYAMLSAPTIDAMLRLVSRYFSLITPTCHFRYRLGVQRAEIDVLPRLALGAQAVQFHVEVIAVAIHAHLSSLSAVTPGACTIDFAGEAPPHAARYDELDGATVRWGRRASPGARVTVVRELARQPLALSDTGAMQMAEARCAELLGRIAGDASLGDWTRMMLREASQGLGTLDELAGILNLSSRTYERRLAAEGLRFRDLASAARHDRARELLAAGRLSVTQIAYELGYSDAANFSRAFRRQAGSAPGTHGGRRRR